MGRRALWVVLAMLAIAGIGKASSQGQAPEAANAALMPADAIWNPSLDQMVGWVTAGLEAAAADMYLPDVAGVDTWTWSGDSPAGKGQRLQWAILLTPQYVGTVTGYEAAWHEDLWDRIQNGDQHAVALELALAVLKQWQPGALRVLLGLTGSDEPRTAAWLRMWHGVSGGAKITAARDEQRLGQPTAQWAALYYLGKVGLGDATGYEVAIEPQPAFWDAQQAVSTPTDGLGAMIGDPGVGEKVLRVYAGTPDQWAFVEWTLPT